MNKELMNGYQSIVRGVYEAGCDVLCVQDTRILPYCDEPKPVIHGGNALQYALGAAIGGTRAVAVCDNIACRDLSSVAHVGANAALVVVLLDDDNRPYMDMRALCACAHLPMMVPSSVYECKTFVKIACNLSEKYDTPVLLSVGQSLLDTWEQIEVTDKKVLHPKAYKRDAEKYVTLPTNNRLCAEDMDVRDKRMAHDCEAFPVNAVDYRDRTMGVITYGQAFAALSVAAPHLSTLRLGMVYPLPMDTIRDFAAGVEDVVVLEEGEPLVETALLSQGVKCRGKEMFALRMHYSPAEIQERLLGTSVAKESNTLPIRTPAFCGECPLIEVFTAIKKAEIPTHADTRCAYLAANIPMICVDTAFSSSPVALGAGFSEQKPCVSVVGTDCLDWNDLCAVGEQQTILIYGDIQKVQPQIRAFCPSATEIEIKNVQEYLTKPGVWLVRVDLGCRHG